MDVKAKTGDKTESGSRTKRGDEPDQLRARGDGIEHQHTDTSRCCQERKKKRQSNRPTGQKTARDRQMSGKRREIFGDNTRARMGASPAHVSYVLRCTPSGAGSSGAAKYAVNLTLGGLSTPIDGN